MFALIIQRIWAVRLQIAVSNQAGFSAAIFYKLDGSDILSLSFIHDIIYVMLIQPI